MIKLPHINPRLKKWLIRIGNWIINIYLTAFCLFAAWVLAQVFCFASFSTPTTSMTPTIIPGDYVLINKFVMGGRLFNIFDALEGKQVKIWRGPHFSSLKSGDIVVFNHPYAERWDSIAMNINLYYMKRCIAVPGDTVEIRNCRYLINGEPADVGVADQQKKVARFLDTYASDPATIKKSIVVNAFPTDSAVGWTIRDFGPIILPRKGTVLHLDQQSAIIYRNYIEWETGMKLSSDSTGVRLGDEPLDAYTFQKEYCFVAGDYAFNSQDSRYFGLLPVEFVVGKAAFIWQSIDKTEQRRRWNRTFKGL